MRELLCGLTEEARVLDLGSAGGSFPDSLTKARVLRLDRDAMRGLGVRADAARMPFRDGVFDVVVANHSFEHFEELELVLRELGRRGACERVYGNDGVGGEDCPGDREAIERNESPAFRVILHEPEERRAGAAAHVAGGRRV